MVELDADSCSKKEGRARVLDSLRMCARRNEVAGRHLRAIQKGRRAFTAVDTGELTALRAACIKKLNVDFGLIYAASIVAESRTLSAGKVLPGASARWRSRPMFYARALKHVIRIYDARHKNGELVYNAMPPGRFLTKLREDAACIF